MKKEFDSESVYEVTDFYDKKIPKKSKSADWCPYDSNIER